MDSLPVSTDYRFTIPEDPREHFGIEDGDFVTVTLLLDGETATFHKKVDRARVTIPDRIRDRYGIESGDTVDVEMAVP